MNENIGAPKNFIGYEYKDITVSNELESLYMDAYQNFGWILENRNSPIIGLGSFVTLKFKRDRKIRNKAELTRLQRQFSSCMKEIESMEKSKESNAFIASMSTGLVGAGFVTGAIFAYFGSMIVLCAIFALPGLVGVILPYFLHGSTYAKRAAKIAPLIEQKYDEIYEVCERANSLLGNFSE